MQLVLECLGDRFLALLTVFHLYKNEAKAARGQSGYDPQFKIWPILDTLLSKFQDVCTPEEQLPIDKAICHLRVYILSCLYQRKAPQIWNKNV